MGIKPLSQATLRRSGGRYLARLIRAVLRTSTIVMEPPDLKERLRAQHPVIIAAWHGQFMMLVYLNPPGIKVAAMVARHGDAEFIGEAMADFGIELIRGAGAGERKKNRGGVHALRAAVSALTGAGGMKPASLVMTADVPPGPARQAGAGIITIARLSGCAIVPVAAASSRYKSFRTWSRMTINLPFSKLAFVAGPPIYVARDSDEARVEVLRQELEQSLNTITARAYQLADSDPSRATPPHLAAAAVSPGFLLKTYAVGTSAMRALVGPLLRYRVGRGKEDAQRLDERRGLAGIVRPTGCLVWIHAASVGETNAILPLITAFKTRRPDTTVLLTTTTLTSAEVARKRLPAGAIHQFVPLDAPQYATRFVDYWKPDLAIFTESEIWPSLILATAERKVPLALVNARMSPKSYKSWKRLTGIAEPVFSRFTIILAQNEKLARWFREVGGRRVVPVGNLKADAPAPPIDAMKLEALKSALGSRPRVLAASTHDGEERIVSEAHRLLAVRFPGFCTIIAPRHPDRGAVIAAELQGLGFKTALRSQGEALTAETEIYIADTIGELGTLYALCSVAFIGGSLVERGGQNPIEAISIGAAVLTGPSTHNFRDEYTALANAKGSITITNAQILADCVAALESDPAARSELIARARATVDQMKGALDRTVAALLPLLPSVQTSSTGKNLQHAS
jgi:3-deoxy-D-manno-octulosonic-acid transferase